MDATKSTRQGLDARRPAPGLQWTGGHALAALATLAAALLLLPQAGAVATMQEQRITFDTPSTFQMAITIKCTGNEALSIRALFNRTRSDDMVQLDGVQRLRVASHRSNLAVSLDGEVDRETPPLDYRIRPLALRVIAPPR